MKKHVVILGAGATMAAIPDGDKNEKKSSVMNGLLNELGLEDLIKDITLETKSNNLEDIYSELHDRGDCSEVLTKLEQEIRDYFSSMEIPDEPTIYDFLILSLTKKDLIATFNWDPLIIQAYERCSKITKNLPNLHFLHGNVGVFFCKEHDEYGSELVPCPICGCRLSKIALLYPVEHKNYHKEQYISNAWETLANEMKSAHMLTIFGYSAPSSDTEAVDMLKESWNNKQIEEFSIIDIEDAERVKNKWKEFTYHDHYRITSDVFESYLGKFPRRSCEQIIFSTMFGVPSDDSNGFKKEMNWNDIELFLQSLREEEIKQKNDNFMIHNEYQVSRDHS